MVGCDQGQKLTERNPNISTKLNVCPSSKTGRQYIPACLFIDGAEKQGVSGAKDFWLSGGH